MFSIIIKINAPNQIVKLHPLDISSELMNCQLKIYIVTIRTITDSQNISNLRRLATIIPIAYHWQYQICDFTFKILFLVILSNLSKSLFSLLLLRRKFGCCLTQKYAGLQPDYWLLSANSLRTTGTSLRSGVRLDKWVFHVLRSPFIPSIRAAKIRSVGNRFCNRPAA